MTAPPGPSETDRRAVLAERDAARRERVIRDLREQLDGMARRHKLAELEIAEQQRQIARLEVELRRLFLTPSWRWSAPLRRAIEMGQRLRAVLGGPPPDKPDLPPPLSETVQPPPPPLSLRERAILHRLEHDRIKLNRLGAVNVLAHTKA